MTTLNKTGAAMTFVLVTAIAVAAQQPTTTEAGSRDASITTSRTVGQTQQPRPLPRTTPTPVTPVRPLTEEERTRQEASSARRRQEASTGDPDVLLDVPNLSVDEIHLEVENLRAKVSLDARLANLLSLSAGADGGIESFFHNITRGVHRALHCLAQRIDRLA